MRRGQVFVRHALVGLLAAVGCDDSSGVPITGDEAVVAAHETVDHHADAIGEIGNFLSTTRALGLMEDLEVTSLDCEGGKSVPGARAEVAAVETDAADLGDWLEEHIFRADLIESEDGDTIMFRLDPAVLCVNDNADPGTPEIDETCESYLTNYPVRLKVTSPRSGDLDITVHFGEAARTLAKVRLYEDEVAVRLELGVLLRVFEAVAAEEEEPPDFPDTLTGALQLRVKRHGAGDHSIDLSVLEDVAVAFESGEAAGASLSIARSTPAAELRAIEGLDQVRWLAGLGPVEVRVPGALLCDDSDEENPSNCGQAEKDGLFVATLAGLTGSLTAEGGAGVLSFENLGLGSASSTLALDDKELVRADLNTKYQRTFDLTLKRVDDGVDVMFEPALDMAVAMKLVQLSESLRTDLPDWLADELFELTFGGPPRAKLHIPVEDRCGQGNGAGNPEVVEGTLTLAASSLASDLVVTQGMCIARKAHAEAEGDPPPHLFDEVVSETCQ